VGRSGVSWELLEVAMKRENGCRGGRVVRRERTSKNGRKDDTVNVR